MRKNRYNIIQSDLEDAYSSQVKGGSEAGKLFRFVMQKRDDSNISQTSSTSTVDLACLLLVGALHEGGHLILGTTMISLNGMPRGFIDWSFAISRFKCHRALQVLCLPYIRIIALQ